MDIRQLAVPFVGARATYVDPVSKAQWMADVIAVAGHAARLKITRADGTEVIVPTPEAVPSLTPTNGVQHDEGRGRGTWQCGWM